ncbi:hypothetical protein IGI04_009626 [Brassica rapa subsp. trilocularis]|uniref:PORR domain-containing protein n=1 Tax=Brassica rapa subsp. trilocularis TaxID=1813537 RepID=A0ABQ7MXZ4_BRACM|nr:hypothetical protein IGI04_009626 [Brassica rapa subsp. trilocularis]
MHVDSKEFDKRGVAVMHELLIFTLENRLATTDHLTHFRREFVMPQKLMRGRTRDIPSYCDTLEMDEGELLGSGSGDEGLRVGFEKNDDYMIR